MLTCSVLTMNISVYILSQFDIPKQLLLEKCMLHVNLNENITTRNSLDIDNIFFQNKA